MGTNPVVSECDGDYTTEKRSLLWQLPVIDSSNKTGSMEFACANSNPDDFFPVNVSFYSKKAFSEIKVLECAKVDDANDTVKFSTETIFIPEKYEIV